MLTLYCTCMKAWFDHIWTMRSQEWDTHLQKDIRLLEGVQKFSLRMCSKDYDMNYEVLLQSFQLPEQSTRRLYFRLSLMFKIVHESFFSLPIFLYPRSQHHIMQNLTCIINLLLVPIPSFTHLCFTLILHRMVM